MQPEPTPRILFPFVTLHILLCIDPSPPWDLFSAFALALTGYLTISMNVLKIDTGIGFVNYVHGTAVMTCIAEGFYLLLVGKPLTNFKYTGHEGGSAQKVWWKKYFDVVCIPLSPRLIGWNHQVKNIPPSPQQTKGSFIFRSTLRAAMYIVLFEAGHLYVWYNPAYSSAAIGTQGYFVQFINTAVFVGLLYWASNAIYFIAAAGSVAIGMYSPRMWPDLYGAWGDAYTVRRFWGQTWHQMLRGVLTPLGKAMSTALVFKPGALGSSYTQLYVAFFMSGLFHSGGDIILSCTSTPSQSSRPFFSMQFFLLQAFIITIEDMLIWVARRLGVKNCMWTRFLGYIWVAAWFGWCVSGFVRDMIRAGGGIRKPGADVSDIGTNLVQAMLGLLGFNISMFAESEFPKA